MWWVQKALEVTAREGAPSVAVLELAHHPAGRPTGGPPDPDRLTEHVVEHDLEPAVAQEPAAGLGVDDGAVLDIAAALVAPQGTEVGMDHHGRPVGVGI